ncbi:MAG TPA: hypothetical protein PLZ60_09930 [Kiritimatiellia bacterium]|nr:hypothetical protein [Kiritimatiellia bacterium]
MKHARASDSRSSLVIGEQTIPVTIRLTETQAEQLKLLGGPKLMRAQIDKSARAAGHFT